MNFIRELFAIDVYADMPPEDPEQDAVFAPPWSTLPWHLMVLMEEAVGRGWALWSASSGTLRKLVRNDWSRSLRPGHTPWFGSWLELCVFRSNVITDSGGR